MLNVAGLISIILFYLLILGIGLYAAWTRREVASQGGADDLMIAGRSIGLFVGALTMTATWVGGGYINGSAEAIFTSGLLWCQAPIGYAISLTLGGLFFAKKMRDANYVTMLDPLQKCFGHRWGAMLYLPALAGETLWSASILAALGSTLTVIVGLSNDVAIVVSAAIAVVYTLFGGLYSVAYTDVVQLFCILIGLWAVVPFALNHRAVGSLASTDWAGSIPPDQGYQWGMWSDYAILLIFGGIPWQVYFQRVLSAKSSRQAQRLSFVGSFGCVVMAVPACIIGAIAKATDWTSTSLNRTLDASEHKMVLPLVMQHLTPGWAAFLGLGAVSAAVMSSADSSVLSASSMFARNIYRNALRPKAREAEIIWVMRFSVLGVATMATLIAINGNSIYDLFYLCGDFVYVMLFPQLLFAVHGAQFVNTYGSIAAYFFGFTLRILGGEEILGIPTVIHYPYFIDGTQYFPFRTLSMVVTLIALPLVSFVSKKLLGPNGIFAEWDVLRVFSDGPSQIMAMNNEFGRRINKGVDNESFDIRSCSVEKPPSCRNVVSTRF